MLLLTLFAPECVAPSLQCWVFIVFPMVYAGYASGQRNVSISNFTKLSAGVYTYNYTAVALELVVFSLYVDNAKATCYPATLCYGNSISLSLYTVLPSVVDTSATVNKTVLQVEGDTVRSGWNATGPAVVLPVNSWHRMYVPVTRVGGGSFYIDPKLYVQLVLNGTNTTWVTINTNVAVSANSTNSTNSSSSSTNMTTVVSNTTAVVTTIPLLFKGYWSSSNGWYVVAFKIPSTGLWTGQVELRQSNISSTSIVSKGQSWPFQYSKRSPNPTCSVAVEHHMLAGAVMQHCGPARALL